MSTTTAVVTIVHGRHDHLRRHRRALLTGSRTPDLHVVVAMGDAEVTGVMDEGVDVLALEADPRRLPLAAARNAGARAALRGGADVLVFLDVDCLAGPDLVAAYAEVALRDRATLWSGPVTYLGPGDAEEALRQPDAFDSPHPARPAPRPGEELHGADPVLFWSLSFAVHREGWRRSGGFCERYAGYGAEDTDFAVQAAARGMDHAWVGSARAHHQHHPTSDPPVQHLDAILRNARTYHERWGSWPMEGWLRDFAALGLATLTDDGWQAT